MGMPRPISVSGSIYHKVTDYRPKDGDAKFCDSIYDVEDFAFAFIRFEGGQTLQLSCSWTPNDDVGIVTEGGRSHFREIEHFADCITTGKPLLSPASETIQVVKMLDEM